jgi:aryl-alcohol dehydrogenase-like predicted oxidoreductase
MQYSLVVRDIEREVVPACQRFGVGILPWSPLAAGFLTGKYERSEKAPAGARLTKWEERLRRYDTEQNWKIVDTLTAVAGELGTTPAAVALAWVAHQPGVTSVIFGARSLEQLDANLAAGELSLPPALLAKLDEVSALVAGYPYDFIRAVQGRW